MGSEPATGVSVIMPAYNAERYIAEAIESVRAQTYEDWELIVIDDGSTDNTAAKVQSFVAKDPRIKLISQQNGGPGSARNAGLRQASEELVAFLDSDDLWFPEKLELQVRTFKKTNADIIFGGALQFEDERSTDESVSLKTVVGTFAGKDMFKLLFEQNPIPMLTVFARKSVLAEANWFDETQNIGEDYDLWFKTARNGAVFHGMDATLSRYRRQAASLSASPVTTVEATIPVLRKYVDDPNLDRRSVIRRIRSLYRYLIRSFLEEGKTSEARHYVDELVSLDHGIVSYLQKILIRVLPGAYNFISRPMYGIELRLERLTGPPNDAATFASSNLCLI